MSKLKTLLEKLSKLQLGIAFAALAAVIIINFLEICMRYFAGQSMVWIQDYSLLLMVWIIFPGAGVIAYQKRDVTITILTDHLPETFGKYLEIAVCIVVSIFFALLGRYSTTLFLKQGGQTTVTAMIPLRFYSLSLVVTSFYMAVVYLHNAVDLFLKRKGG